ncbi:MAG TPA: hypothetical protein VHU84_15020 [Lacipirellulaceae bacterium]|nr:hypothetical protein [Lacipirellulaceae bacterium]
MDRFHARVAAANRYVAVLLAALLLIVNSGCPALIATGMYVLDGGNIVPAEFDGLKSSRVVVMCKPPSSNEFRHAGAARSIAAKVSDMLVKNVKGIDVVSPRDVDNWVDESDGGDFHELAQAVHADKVVHIQLDDFELYKGKTLYQGRADVTVTVYDMKNHSKVLWDKHLGEVLYPVNSGIPAQDKPVQQFEREFVDIVADRVSTNFYRHDPNESFALDAMANR